MRPMIGPATFVVPLQNGVEAPSQLAAALGTEHVLGAANRGLRLHFLSVWLTSHTFNYATSALLNIQTARSTRS